MQIIMPYEEYVIRKNLGSVFHLKGKSLLLHKICFELTERCNSNCLHCYINLPADDLEAKKKELSTIEIKEIFKDAVSLGCLEVIFSGGEPLLRDDFEELYLCARRLGLRTVIFTNGTLIDRYLAELFSKVPPLEKIEVSVYGIKKDSYESVTRTPNSFEACLRGIDLLLKFKIPFVVKGAILPQNKEDIEKLDNWAVKTLGMGHLPRYTVNLNLHARGDEKRNIAIRKLRISPGESVSVLTRNLDNYMRDRKEFCAKFMGPPGERIFSCGAGRGKPCIDAYGALQPCMLLRHPACVYDLKKGSLKEALVNFFPNMRKIKATNREYLRRCAQCFLKSLCEQCPAQSWMEHGTLDTPVEYFCGRAHAEARFLGLLKNGEMAWEVNDWQERILALSDEAISAQVLS